MANISNRHDAGFRIAVIQEIDQKNQIIIAQDQVTNGQIQISTHFWEPLSSIPQPGELWLCRNQGIDWFLDRRLENGSEFIPITALSPGDRRIEANTLYLSGNEIILSSGILSSLDEQLSIISSAPPFTLTKEEVIATGLTYTDVDALGATQAAGGDLTGNYPNPTIRASVGLTGNPTSTTPATSDNSTAIATTAWTRSLGLMTNVFNVKYYGAKGDGSTDDTTAIQNAILACEAAGGGVVYFPQGIYMISSTLLVQGDGVGFEGCGAIGATVSGTGGTTYGVGTFGASPYGSTPGGVSPSTSPTIIRWNSSTISATTKMVAVSKGGLSSGTAPISGFTMEEIELDGQQVAAYLLWTSVLQFARLRGVSLRESQRNGVGTGTHDGTGLYLEGISGTNPATKNRFDDLYIDAATMITMSGSGGGSCIQNLFSGIWGQYGSPVSNADAVIFDQANSNQMDHLTATRAFGLGYSARFRPSSYANYITYHDGPGVYVDNPSNSNYHNLVLGADRSDGQAPPAGPGASNLTWIDDSSTSAQQGWTLSTPLSTAGPFYPGGRSGSFIQTGIGTPQNSLSAPVSSIYMQTDGSPQSCAYIKQIGSGNTGWAALGPTRQANLYKSYGVMAQSYELLSTAGTNFAPTAGHVYGSGVYLYAGEVVSNIVTQITASGSGSLPTLTKVGIWSSVATPACLAVSNDISSSLTATGFVQLPLSSSYTVTSDGVYYLALLGVGTFGTNQPKYPTNNLFATPANQIGSNTWFAPTLKTGATDMVVTNTGSYTTSTQNIWMGCN